MKNHTTHWTVFQQSPPIMQLLYCDKSVDEGSWDDGPWSHASSFTEEDGCSMLGQEGLGQAPQEVKSKNRSRLFLFLPTQDPHSSFHLVTVFTSGKNCAFHAPFNLPKSDPNVQTGTKWSSACNLSRMLPDNLKYSQGKRAVS